MVFSSVPVYLDPPNWPQQQNHQQGENPPQLQAPLMPPPPPVGVGGGGGGGSGGPASIRPGSMAERARLAKLPQPETALKCPRCESANTKFCYFNNYSLTQPRHFCKTCRRYWTRGGALRNVPVGGGCRRNKRSKGGSRSKSPITSENRSSSTTSTRSISSNNNNSCSTDMNMIGHFSHPPHHQLSFFPPTLHNNLTDFGNAEMGLIQPTVGPLNLSARFADQWRLQQVQQFPFLAGLEQSSTGGVYQFEGDCIDQPLGNYGGCEGTDQISSKALEVAGDSVKMEENQQGLHLSRNFLSVNPGNDQYWSGNSAWNDFSGSTSSASHLM
ncbi:hypothetical protein ACH5RR_016638 [Cinchona calisaya]|uniref:Dof zinc finger protein n=1 Tax=Cinchona calisaya TaxID=153742 RepID=A0ABD2ZXJ0_9GENT